MRELDVLEAIRELRRRGEMDVADFAVRCGYSLKYFLYFKLRELMALYPEIEYDKARKVVRWRGDMLAPLEGVATDAGSRG